MEIDYQITLEDWIAINRIHWRKKAKQNNLVMLWLVLLFIAIIVKCVHANFIAIVPIFLILGLICLFRLLGTAEVDSAAKKYYNHPNNQSVFLNRTYIFKEEGLATVSEAGHALTYWTHIPKIMETSDYFLIYVSDQAAELLAKRAFTTEQMQQLHDYFENSFKNAYQVLNK